MSGYRIKNGHEGNLDEFIATYKGYDIRIERIGLSVDPDVVAMDDYWEDVEPEPDGKAFWAVVQNDNGVAMQGYVGNEGDSLELVLDEVLLGATLITEDQRKFPARTTA